MAALSTLLSVAEPTGFWATIIKAFEGGVGSYILAIVLLTLVIRIIWAPFDTFNKKINKKNARIQAKMQPELDKLKAKYGNDKNLLNQKTQELYKRNNFSMAGSCVFMLIFMALNLTIFFTLFAGLNAMADFKISQEYDNLKYNYANVLNLTDEQFTAENTEFFENYENITFKVEEKIVGEGENQTTVKYLVAYNGEQEVARTEWKNKTDFETWGDKLDEEEQPVVGEDGKVVREIKVTSDQEIASLVTKFVSPQNKVTENGEVVKDEDGNPVYEDRYVGYQGILTDAEGNEITLKQAIDNYSSRYIKYCYENAEEKSSFLWIANYWVADSPFKRSIFTFDQFKSEIGANNVSAQEATIYNAFMPNLDKQVGRVNGYLILAVLSIGVSFLSMFLSNLGNKKKGVPGQKQPGGKVMMFIMPIIMGVFAIFYNSVFAIYLVVSQAISAALAPLENLIINKWDAHDEKKAEEKSKSVVSYRRK